MNPLTINEIAVTLKCTKQNISRNIKKFNLKPVGVVRSKYNVSVNIYDLDELKTCLENGNKKSGKGKKFNLPHMEDKTYSVRSIPDNMTPLTKLFPGVKK